MPRIEDLVREEHEKVRAESPTPNTRASEWPEPAPIGDHALPALPVEAVPGLLGEHALAVAKATETPFELAAMMDLAAVATCTQGKFAVNPEPGYVEPTNVWCIPAMASGNRKTAVFNESTAPIRAWEREQAEALQPKIEQAESKRKTLSVLIEKLRKKAADPSQDIESLQKQIEELEAQLPRVPTTPRLWSDDVTPENLGVVMAEHGDRIAILSDEGGIFELMGGRYNNGIPNLDIFLKAHAGSAVRVDRGSRPPIYMERPALTIGLAPQPEVLYSLARKPEFRGRGLLARCLFWLPESRLGYRNLEPMPVPAGVKQAYGKAICDILKFPSAGGDDNPPYLLSLDPSAHCEWKDFQRSIETGMREGEALSHLTDWASKLPGAAARIAGVLHVAEHAFDEPWKYPISGTTMDSAVTVCTVAIPHALATFELMGEDHLRRDARAVVRWIHRRGKPEFTARDCFCARQGQFKRMDAVWPVLELLVQHGYIRVAPRQTVNHRPSRCYLVNPRVLEGKNK